LSRVTEEEELFPPFTALVSFFWAVDFASFLALALVFFLESESEEEEDDEDDESESESEELSDPGSGTLAALSASESESLSEEESELESEDESEEESDEESDEESEEELEEESEEESELESELELELEESLSEELEELEDEARFCFFALGFSSSDSESELSLSEEESESEELDSLGALRLRLFVFFALLFLSLSLSLDELSESEDESLELSFISTSSEGAADEASAFSRDVRVDCLEGVVISQPFFSRSFLRAVCAAGEYCERKLSTRPRTVGGGRADEEASFPGFFAPVSLFFFFAMVSVGVAVNGLEELLEKSQAGGPLPAPDMCRID